MYTHNGIKNRTRQTFACKLLEKSIKTEHCLTT